MTSGYDQGGDFAKGKHDRINRRLDLEEHVTSGWDNTSQQTEMCFMFWESIFPTLESVGWTKSDGTGNSTGSIHFYPEGAQYYYDRIRGVIDRLLERRTKTESELADKYLADLENSSVGKKNGPDLTISRPRRRADSKARPQRETAGSNMIDLAWKSGGKDYPKKASKVGPEYQVAEIPDAGTYQEQKEQSDAYCDLVWDPEQAKTKGISLASDEKILSSIPYNKKEGAYLLLAERGYTLDGFSDALNEIKPIDGSDWSPDKKKRFFTEIFRLRKDLRAVSKSMEIEMKACLTYYLGTYKKSDDYRVLKTVCEEKRQEKTEGAEFGVDSCAICDDGGSLLICDGCEGEYHMGCLRPPLETVPDGHWECDTCVDRKFLDARDYLIRNSKLFQKKDIKKRSIDDMLDGSESEESEPVAVEPTELALDAIRKLAGSVSSAFSKEAPAQLAVDLVTVST